jgi:thiol peroxidase
MTTSQFPETPNAVLFRGTPMTLVGPKVIVGEPAPDFRLTTGAMQIMTLEEAIDRGKRNALFIALPSLDTPTCNIETNTFNKRLREMPPNAAVFVVSMDLPFAQNRWAAANGAEALTYLSDYRERSFATAYGVLIKELVLLARANFIVSKDRTVAYAEIVPEIASEPNYDATLAALKKLA